MSGLFDRLGSAFVAPQQEGQRAAPPLDASAPEPCERRAAGPAALAVLCRPDDAPVVGAAVGLALVTRHRSTCALVAVWRAPEGNGLRAPAARAARRLAAVLAARGHDAAATGRLALVRLAADLNEAAPEAVRALAAAGEVPAVVVLAGARDEVADGLLRDLDGVVVAVPEGADAAVGELALAGLGPLGVDAHAVALPPCPLSTRALAASGVALLPPLRGPVDAGVVALRGQAR